MIETNTLSAIFIFTIIFCVFVVLIDFYLILGMVFPELNITIEQKAKKALKRPPVIILDPWYIRKRNLKWFIWVVVLSNLVLFAIIYIIGSIE